MAIQGPTPHNPLTGERPELTVKLQDGTDEQISIIIVHKDRPAHLNILLQSIVVNSTANNYQIIVVDNGSDQESQDYLDSMEEDVQVVRLQKNMYWSAAANRGVAAADKNSKYLLFLHCDVVVLNPSWLDLLISVSESQGAGIVGTDLQSYFVENAKVDFIQEHCMLVTRECWDDVGPWPEELPMIGNSFILTMRAQQKGHKPQIMRNNVIHHYRVFALKVNEYEKLIEEAMAVMPKLMQQSREVV
jgi:GT2 family glycosyltransferase